MAVLLGNEGGGLYGGVILEIPILESQTWVPPRDGTINIIAIGAGGSGGLYTPTNGGIALGGGAGGYCAKENVSVTTNGSYSISIGAGGAGVYSNGSIAGNAGGNTTVSGTGLSATITANGGAGGGGTSTYSANANYGTGAAGGTASNGDINRVGGKGGGFSPAYVTSNTSTRCATGGGAVAILSGVGYQGGSFVKTGNAAGQTRWASGGAGIGGRGGGAWNIDGALSPYYGGMSGGGAAGPGEDVSDSAQMKIAPNGPYVQGMQQAGWKYKDLSLIGASRAMGGMGGSGYAANNGGGERMPTFNLSNQAFPNGQASSSVGAGGGGCYTTSTNQAYIAGFGGAFAGGGGQVSSASYSNNQPGGNGGIGGGGGGNCAQQGYNKQQPWGGQGVVFIHYTAFA